MKALSVKQPFAALIAAGIKKYETRSWATKYRGPLLIHASLTPHPLQASYDLHWEILELDNMSAERIYEVSRNLISREGSMVCVVDLVDVIPFENTKEAEDLACCDWYDGFAWVLENPRITIMSSHLKGKLNLFDVPDEQIELAPKNYTFV